MFSTSRTRPTIRPVNWSRLAYAEQAGGGLQFADEELAEPEGQDEQDSDHQAPVHCPGDGRHRVRLQRLALPDYESGAA
jgi:hypothetical protein